VPERAGNRGHSWSLTGNPSCRPSWAQAGSGRARNDLLRSGSARCSTATSYEESGRPGVLPGVVRDHAGSGARFIDSGRPPVTGSLTRGGSPVSNCYVKPPVDVISAGPRTISSRVAWVLAAALLAAALAGAITVAVHYRGEVASLRRQLRSVPASHRLSTVPLMLSSRTVTLPSYGALDSAVTVVSARFSGGLEQIALSAHISGGRPHAGYTLIGFDCAGSTGYESWAAGVTDAHGSGNLNGRAWTVSLTDEYWLYLSPSSSGIGGPGVHISFTSAGRFSAFPAGDQPCTNS
jgi:hypothetical protein